MEPRPRYVLVGAFVLAVVFVAFGMVAWLGRAQFVEAPKPYYVFFKGSVAGLSRGSPVQYNGIPVGRVVDVRVDPDNVEQVQVTANIDTSLVTIKSDARAYLETNILSGISTVQIRGGTQAAAELEAKPGHRYPVIKPGRSELEEVKASLPELLGEVNAAAGKINLLLDDKNRAAISESLQNIRKATSVFADRDKDLGPLLANANAAAAELESLLRTVEESYAGNGGFKDQLAQTLGDYDRLAKSLTDNSRQIQQILQENRPGVREFTQTTLTAVGSLVRGMQRVATGLARFAEEVERDPARLLFGDRREGYRPQ